MVDLHVIRWNVKWKYKKLKRKKDVVKKKEKVASEEAAGRYAD